MLQLHVQSFYFCCSDILLHYIPKSADFEPPAQRSCIDTPSLRRHVELLASPRDDCVPVGEKRRREIVLQPFRQLGEGAQTAAVTGRRCVRILREVPVGVANEHGLAG
jgi:hypothetical protein